MVDPDGDPKCPINVKTAEFFLNNLLNLLFLSQLNMGGDVPYSFYMVNRRVFILSIRRLSSSLFLLIYKQRASGKGLYGIHEPHSRSWWVEET